MKGIARRQKQRVVPLVNRQKFDFQAGKLKQELKKREKLIHTSKKKSR